MPSVTARICEFCSLPSASQFNRAKHIRQVKHPKHPLHCASKKFTILVFTNNWVRCWPILMIFVRNVAEEICSKQLYSFHYIVKHVHNKTEKSYYAITSRDARRNVTHRLSQYQLISQPKLDKFQSQCYSKCSKWLTSTYFHAAVQTFVPLIDSVVDRCRWNPWRRRRLPGNVR